jgi:hypothetical protein
MKKQKNIKIPRIKPRNPNIPKGSQRHEDKRTKEKYKKPLDVLE